MARDQRAPRTGVSSSLFLLIPQCFQTEWVISPYLSVYPLASMLSCEMGGARADWFLM